MGGMKKELRTGLCVRKLRVAKKDFALPLLNKYTTVATTKIRTRDRSERYDVNYEWVNAFKRCHGNNSRSFDTSFGFKSKTNQREIILTESLVDSEKKTKY